jgi:hypothetical protein
MARPEWWRWELELTPHVEMRMEDRGFTELELRHMLERAQDLRPDVVEGRWIVETTHLRHRWEVVVEPDWALQRLVIITAHPRVSAQGA